MLQTVRSGLVVLVCSALGSPGGVTQSEAALSELVRGIQRDDYRGDLEGLERALADLEAHQADPELGPAARYWKGFAYWRLALNRMNLPDYDRARARRELESAVAAFDAVGPGSLAADAESGAAGCLMSVLFIAGGTDPKIRELFEKTNRLLTAAKAAEPENPRVLWILGGQRLWTPKEHGGSREQALELYQRGLANARLEAETPPAELEPRWGEAELLMSIAYAYANFAPIDPERARTFALEALALQPEWKYVRETLLPSLDSAPK